MHMHVGIGPWTSIIISINIIVTRRMGARPTSVKITEETHSSREGQAHHNINHAMLTTTYDLGLVPVAPYGIAPVGVGWVEGPCRASLARCADASSAHCMSAFSGTAPMWGRPTSWACQRMVPEPAASHTCVGACVRVCGWWACVYDCVCARATYLSIPIIAPLTACRAWHTPGC